jgi:hypothetical protein
MQPKNADDERIQDHLDSDGGYSIERRRGDRAHVSAATSHSFDPRSNVTDVTEV